MVVNQTTFLTDTIKFIRDYLDDNVTDPISSRAATERFVMTSYPKRKVTYPVITVVDNGSFDIERLGQQSELHVARLPIEIRVWARNIKERDAISEEVYTKLRTNQYNGGGGSIENGLHDFKLDNMVNIDEPGTGTPKSKILTVSYMFVGGN